MALLYGEYNHSLDSKNRLFIPAKMRELLENSFFLSRNVDGCIDILPREVKEDIENKLNALPRSKTADIRRFLFPMASESLPDSQGRVLIPQNLVEFAGITKNVVIIGAGDHAEIWNEEEWLKRKQEQSADDIRAAMEELGL